MALVVKNPPANTGNIRDMGSIPGSGTSPGGGHGNPLQYSCLENPMDRGAWRATVLGVAESDMTEQLMLWASQVVLAVKNLPAKAGDIRDRGLIPGSGTSPGGGRGNPLQYSCLEKPMDRGAWQLQSTGPQRVRHD